MPCARETDKSGGLSGNISKPHARVSVTKRSRLVLQKNQKRHMSSALSYALRRCPFPRPRLDTAENRAVARRPFGTRSGREVDTQR